MRSTANPQKRSLFQLTKIILEIDGVEHHCEVQTKPGRKEIGERLFITERELFGDSNPRIFQRVHSSAVLRYKMIDEHKPN